MIVVDTSALAAIFRREAEAAVFLDILTGAEQAAISPASVLECSIVLRSTRELDADEAEIWLDALIGAIGLEIVPIDEAMTRLAREAHGRFGKGTGHPAQLNFGDCFSYALAKSLDAPLLFKGDDFGRTDLASVFPR